MGSGLSHFAGCFSRAGQDGSYGCSGVQFSEPLDEGLGHSFCYVRPAPLGSPPLVTPDQSEELKSSGKQGLGAAGTDEPFADAADVLASSKEEQEKLQAKKGRVERPRRLFEKPKVVSKTFSETSFKAISGASVSANTATPRSVASYEQFNSFANFIYDRAAAFESSSSFAAIPLQPVPKGFSGPFSGSLDKGAEKAFLSGPLERGFMSGPLERGFMSGPLERGFMSGPLDNSADRTHFSAPLNGRYHDTGYWRPKKSLTRFMTNVGRPVKKAFAKTASHIAEKRRTLVIPVMDLIRGHSRESYYYSNASDQDKRGSGNRRGVDSNEYTIEFSSELDVKESDNLQWAQGKAGEDRVHVVISEDQGWIFVGIYDGFSGPDAPDFLMSNLYPAISHELRSLLWDAKGVQLPGVSADDGKDGEEASFEPKTANDKLGNGQTHEFGEIGTRKIHRPRGDMLLVSDLHQESAGEVIKQELRLINNGLDTSEGEALALVDGPCECNKDTDEVREEGCRREKNGFNFSSNQDGPCKCDISTYEVGPGDNRTCPSGSDFTSNVGGSCEHGTLASPADECHRECDEMLVSKKESSNTRKHGVESGVPQSHDANLPVDDMAHADRVLAAKGEGQEENRRAVEEGEIERERTPGILESNAFLFKNLKRKKRGRPGLKFRHGADRRKDYRQKYSQWNGDSDQEESGWGHKVKNAKVAQDPDNVHDVGAEHASVLSALARALETTENAYLEMADKVLFDNPELALMGSCVLVMLMKDEDVYILNVGDSRAILAQQPKVDPSNNGSSIRNGRNGNDASRHSLMRQELERIIEETPMELEALEGAHENSIVEAESPDDTLMLGAVQLTKDHSTNIKEEVSRLRAEHPDEDILENDRVKGKLKVTRAFGAGYLKNRKWNDALLERFQIKFIGTAPYMTCSPALHHHKLGPGDQFLILSSDGLYQYFSNDEVVSQVECFMKRFPDGDPAQHLIEELLFRAAKKAGMDFHELLDIPQGDRRRRPCANTPCNSRCQDTAFAEADDDDAFAVQSSPTMLAKSTYNSRSGCSFIAAYGGEKLKGFHCFSSLGSDASAEFMGAVIRPCFLSPSTSSRMKIRVQKHQRAIFDTAESIFRPHSRSRKRFKSWKISRLVGPILHSIESVQSRLIQGLKRQLRMLLGRLTDRTVLGRIAFTNTHRHRIVMYICKTPAGANILRRYSGTHNFGDNLRKFTSFVCSQTRWHWHAAACVVYGGG